MLRTAGAHHAFAMRLQPPMIRTASRGGDWIVEKNPSLPARFEVLLSDDRAGRSHCVVYPAPSISKPVSRSPVAAILRSDGAWRSRPPGVQHHLNLQRFLVQEKTKGASWPPDSRIAEGTEEICVRC